MLLAFAPIMPASLIEKTIKRLKKNAPSGAADQSAHYALWIKLHDRSSTRDRIKARKYLRKMPCPRISIVMPVYNTPSRWLEKAIKSVRGQLYENWELCIADDASTDAHVREILNRYAAKDPRIKVHYRTENGHISACSNDALALATGDYVGLLDHDDELHETALLHVALEANRYPEAGIIFSDEDKIDPLGQRKEPYFKSDFSDELFLSQNFINHFGVYKRELVQAVGGFRAGIEGCQDWDLALRVLEKCGARNVRHIPRVLYHWRVSENSTSLELKREAICEAKRRTRRHRTPAASQHRCKC